jgi:hypothetical protein
MLSVMTMIEEMGTVLIEEMGTVLIEEAVTCLLIKEAMIVDDPQVHTVEIGVVLTMAMDLIRGLELNQEEVPITIEMQAQSVMDFRAVHRCCRKDLALKKKQ